VYEMSFNILISPFTRLLHNLKYSIQLLLTPIVSWIYINLYFHRKILDCPAGSYPEACFEMVSYFYLAFDTLSACGGVIHFYYPLKTVLPD